jgi:hypothetical protein
MKVLQQFKDSEFYMLINKVYASHPSLNAPHIPMLIPVTGLMMM